MDDEYIEAIIEKLVPGGDGLARVNGLTVFIPGVLPGERVSARLNKRKKGWARGIPADIMEASPDRRRAFCSLFGSCGGCSWQHMSYASQINAKASFCQEALIRQGKFPTESIPPFHIIPSPPQEYRCRVRPVVVGGGRRAFEPPNQIRSFPFHSVP
jgi:23S rRNA (uracil1939-C5)-methyltransferase